MNQIITGTVAKRADLIAMDNMFLYGFHPSPLKQPEKTDYKECKTETERTYLSKVVEGEDMKYKKIRCLVATIASIAFLAGYKRMEKGYKD